MQILLWLTYKQQQSVHMNINKYNIRKSVGMVEYGETIMLYVCVGRDTFL